MRNPNACDSECNKACKIDEYLDIKDFSCEKRLFGKLVLACKDEILNTTEISLDNKKSFYYHYKRDKKGIVTVVLI